ncbi:MAG TPA: glycine betaine ABC transporter substrate-binding protein, partial [Solirubrobacterales bacterium]
MRIDQSRLRVALAGLLVLALALGAAACGGSSSSSSSSGEEGSEGGGGAIVSNPENGKVSLTIGSKNFPEQEILGEIYAQALTAAGYKVKSALNLGSETVAL